MQGVEYHTHLTTLAFNYFLLILEINNTFFLHSVVAKSDISVSQQHFSHLNVEAELLKAFEQSFFVAGNKGLHVRVDH